MGVCCSSESPASNCIWEGLAFRNLNIIRESEGKVGMFFLEMKYLLLDLVSKDRFFFFWLFFFFYRQWVKQRTNKRFK